MAPDVLLMLWAETVEIDVISEEMWARIIRVGMEEKALLTGPFGSHSFRPCPSLTYIYKQFYC